MNDQSRHDEHGLVLDDDPASEPSRLDRRRLVAGVAAGVAGLLLPAPGVTAQGVTAPELDLKRIRWELYNREWDNIPINFYQRDYLSDPQRWIRIQSFCCLTPGAKTVLEQPPNPPGYEPISRLEFGSSLHVLEAHNWAVFTPDVSLDGDTRTLGEGQSHVWNFSGSTREVKVTRRTDTAFKEYFVEFNKLDNQQRTKDDKKDNDNDNNTRRRKRRGGGGGLSDVDQREHPADRLLD